MISSPWLSPLRDDRRALVVVFLRGGADGLSLVAPVGDDAYHRARPTLGVRATAATRLDARFALHPQLSSLAPLFHDGALGIVHAVGSSDTTRSHFEAQDLMEHGGADGGGWLGRFLRARTLGPSGALSAVAVGTSLPESLRGAPSAAVLQSLAEFGMTPDDGAMLAAIESLYERYEGPLSVPLAATSRETVAALRRLDALRRQPAAPAHGADYPDDDFGRGLADIARLIRAQVGLSVATLDLPGWDSHFAQGTLLDPLMDRLTRGLVAFHTDLGREWWASTTVVVMTEFGRRVAENSALGTDHGRGSVMLLMGAAVDGGRVTARWPGLEAGVLDGPGDVPVTTDFRDVLAPLLAWHGVADTSAVFPGWTGA